MDRITFRVSLKNEVVKLEVLMDTNFGGGRNELFLLNVEFVKNDKR